MTRPMPEHGTRARYMRGCRCIPCAGENSRYCKQQKFKVHRSGPARLDPAPVTARINHWVGLGYSHGQIATAAGVSRRIIDSHAKGKLKKINPDSARKILAVRLDASVIPDYLPIDATGSMRRLRALMVMGHPLKAIAAETGHRSGALSKILNGHAVGVRRSTAKDIAALYQRWADTPGPCLRTKLRAAREGWESPLAWGDDIDVPDSLPDTDTPVTKTGMRELAAERLVEMRLLASAGAQPEQIAERLGVTVGYVRKRLINHLPQLYLELTA